MVRVLSRDPRLLKADPRPAGPGDSVYRLERFANALSSQPVNCPADHHRVLTALDTPRELCELTLLLTGVTAGRYIEDPNNLISDTLTLA